MKIIGDERKLQQDIDDSTQEEQDMDESTEDEEDDEEIHVLIQESSDESVSEALKKKRFLLSKSHPMKVKREVLKKNKKPHDGVADYFNYGYNFVLVF